ncbi:PAS domain S-box protein [Aquabacterium sp. CECT 9606]|uniref:PAS domain-containing hybrid sensor histidine kinase/response regulator n=1 Tax=Aquabacterium sp. CECT 9606 TaxID=2845822 RepID=UPI001E315D7B|nr:PAS domain S-box protein [Aquabacterium sp. CECT 9606]CAH0348283.1 Sensor histidine kinase RcsC [Aquabacterium sp. CECT 9606]
MTDSTQKLLAENAELRLRLEEAEETLDAIRSGSVDALVVGEDIYTLDRAHASSNKLRSDVLAQMEDAVVGLDRDERIIYLNPAAERQYGLTASQALGNERGLLYQEIWLSQADQVQAMDSLQQAGAYRARTIQLKHNGQEVHVESAVSVLRDNEGQITGRLEVIRDVSDRHRAEAEIRSAQLKLAQRERQFSTLVENSPDIFARLDRQFRHLYVSPVIERYAGVPASHYLGKTHLELGLPLELSASLNAALEAVFTTGQGSSFSFKFTTPANDVRFLESRLIPEFAEDGSVESVLSIATDRTERERMDSALRESQARLQLTIEAAKIGDWDLDLKTGEARHSARHDQCFGYPQPRADWSYDVFMSHVHPDDRELVERLFKEAVATNGEWHFECRVIWPDGSLHWIEAHGSTYKEGGLATRMLGIVADATDRKLAERALLDADQRKDEFLATLAHELRNPLAPIRNALEIMRLSKEAQAQEKARNMIERQLWQMVHLVDDLMDVSRITQGKLELRRERLDIAMAVQNAIDTSRPLIEARRHALDVRLPPSQTVFVYADVTRLIQIVANLLNNAAKYTPEGGRITLTAIEQDRQAVITIQDTGTGIPGEMLPRVFDMFTQVDRALERSQGGLGIGLALVKKLVEMHGGSVLASSPGLGGGSSFEVRLPALASSPLPDARLATEVSPAPPPRTGPHVLVVDDNLDSAESLATMLGLMGCQTHTAHDGIEAVKAAQALQPDVVLLDIGLPLLTGHEVARRIRAQPWGQMMTLIALTGWGQEEDRRKSRDAGFNHHMVKPVDLNTLEELLAARKLH